MDMCFVPCIIGAIFLLYKQLMDLFLLERSKKQQNVERETKLERKTKLTKIQKLDESNQIQQTGKFLEQKHRQIAGIVW